MNFIGIDKVLFACALDSMVCAADGIGVKKKEWSSMGEESEVFNSYVLEFEQMQRIMKSYRELILKDIEAIRSVGIQMEKMDKQLEDLWN